MNNYEEDILKFWEQNKIFKKSLKKTGKEFVFYDGPPFATGTPHYGHLVASVMKDVVPRYWTMKGYHVERQWGWDCHGLPIENIVEKELRVKSKKALIEKIGIAKFNESCRSKVLKYTADWKKTITRLGRWVDMENPYKTMDLDYMESVWWAFKQLWDKGLIYEDYRSMHICPRCETTLSQSEVSEGYKDIKDIAVTVKFELADEPNTFILAWTTTPWTLIGNVALAVGEDIDYVLVETKKEALKKGSSLGVLSPATEIGLAPVDNNSISDNFVKSNLSTTKNQKGEPDGGPKGSRTPRESVPVRPRSPELGPSHQNPPNLLYQKNKQTKIEKFILAQDRLGGLNSDYKIIKKFKGKNLVGKKYKPLFPYYQKGLTHQFIGGVQNLYTTQSADFVSTEEGTGIVHIAPAFGEDDMNLGKERNLPFIQHVNMDGTFKDEVKDFKGQQVKPAADPKATDKKIVKYLENKGLLFSQEDYLHSYPHCWRCETPLLNYATSSYFVKVTKLKPKLLKLAKQINWSPAHIKEGRFGKWLEGSRDWSISRQRFWATVIPIWRCDKKNCQEQVCIGSLRELADKAVGQKNNKLVKLIKATPTPQYAGEGERNKFSQYLHRPYIDEIKLKCKKCGSTMSRLPDVLDCWFESGSMPYAQMHYPFHNKEKFERNLPAEFIAEGADQTRTWFYYLHVLSTALFEKPAFKNVIVNGIVLASDGKKMSKRLQNYPEPDLIMDKYGSDALRFYLLSSPVMAAENFNFSEAGVKEAYQKVIMLLSNVLSFYEMYADEKGLNKHPSTQAVKPSSNILDKWLLAKLNLVIKEVTRQMDSYDLIRSVRPIQAFINELSTWYIRRSRDRFKGDDKKDKQAAASTLRQVLLTLSKLLAPFAPFLAEHIYLTMKQCNNVTMKESVHLESWPKPNEKLINKKIIQEMDLVRRLASLGLEKRAAAKIPVRQPLAQLKVTGAKLANKDLENLLKDELNIVHIEWQPKGKLKVNIDTKLTPQLEELGIVRELTRHINSLRKQKGLTIKDRIAITYQTQSQKIRAALKNNKDRILTDTLADEIKEASEAKPRTPRTLRGGAGGEGEEEVEIKGEALKLRI